MDQAAAKRYKERWQNVNEISLREQREMSSETTLRQSTELLRLARRLCWNLHHPETEI
jgi:hypothetical protein